VETQQASGHELEAKWVAIFATKLREKQGLVLSTNAQPTVLGEGGHNGPVVRKVVELDKKPELEMWKCDSNLGEQTACHLTELKVKFV
jgi:hypothetical protein